MAYAALSGGRKAVYGRTEDEAEQKACEAERLDVVFTGQKKYIFHHVYLTWFKFKLDFVKPQTMDRVENTYMKYYAASKLDGMDTRQLSTLYVVEFLNSCIKKDTTYKEYQRIFQIINNVYNYAVDTLELKPIDWERVKRSIPKKRFARRKKREVAITGGERAYVTESVLSGKCCYSRFSAALCICLNFYLGLRIGELAVLKWSDIDWVNRTVNVKSTMTKHQERDSDGVRTGHMRYLDSGTPKTVNGYREIPLTDKAVDILQVLRRYHQARGFESVYLCYDGMDGVVTVRVLDRTLRKLCKELGVGTFNSHLIRKTFATDLHNAGVPTKLISDLLGHADILTTERNYIISAGDETEKVRSILENALTTKKGN